MWKFWIDVGGTFTDCIAQDPVGREHVLKVLSGSLVKNRWPGSSHNDSFTDERLTAAQNDFWAGYRLVLQDKEGEKVAERTVIASRAQGTLEWTPAAPIGAEVAYYELHSPEPSPIFAVRILTGCRLNSPLPVLEMNLGTTRGTNALLTRTGSPTVFAVTEGFLDLLEIGEQDRPRLFDLNVCKPRPLYSHVVEIRERLAADGSVLKPVDLNAARQVLLAAKGLGAESVAICLMHAYRNPQHENQVADLAREVGFAEVSCSNQVSPLIKLVPRAETTVLDAYLNPVIRSYADEIQGKLSSGSRLLLMASDGSLVSRARFSGKDSVLSGPAGGVVGFARAAEQAGFQKAIGFDMGGTSTDVARYDGQFEIEYETRKAGIRVVTPLLAIETVAAGGGSICEFSGGRLTVGPASAGSIPGPACYGRGGPLAMTDINVFLGRISETQFPFALDRGAVLRRLDQLSEKIQLETGQCFSHEELATGYLKIANHNMASAIRTVSVAKGYDARDYVLVAFGGAGPQHATGIAAELGIRQVLVHPYASVQSAAGIRMAHRQAHTARAVLQEFTEDCLTGLERDCRELSQEVRTRLLEEGLPQDTITVERSWDLRFAGTEPCLNVRGDTWFEIKREFLKLHRQFFGYVQDRAIELVSVRLTALQRGSEWERALRKEDRATPPVAPRQTCHVGSGWEVVPHFDWRSLRPGMCLPGPALIADSLTTCWVDTGWEAEVLMANQLLLSRPNYSSENSKRGGPAHEVDRRLDPVKLEVFSNSFRSLARQMGVTLQRTSVSVNIKDRLDFSCAIFNAQGDLVVNAPHIPVHLGAMSETVREVIRLNPKVREGDVFVTNDPYAGGSHLPDVSVVTPVFSDGKIAFWVASRGHHAEIGGKTPGSMPPDATCLADEGVLIQNLKLIDGGVERFEKLEARLRSGPYPSRNVPDNIADIRAQVAANQVGVKGLLELVQRDSLSEVSSYMNFLLDAAESQVRAALQAIPDGDYRFVDQMDNGRRIRVLMKKFRDRLTVDFSGTDPVSPDNLNANRAICMAAIMYVMRCLLDTEIPLNEGVIRPVSLHLPECFLNPQPGSDATQTPAIVGGNVETSQRVVDVLLGGLGLAAASQGTMNNWLMGNDRFGYYETLGGGSGATAKGPGADAVHVHMSNTRLTDPEVLESRFPVRLVAFGVARGTGGKGRFAGGCGMIRSLEFLERLTVSLLTSRRNCQPYGLQGGMPGARGQNLLRRKGQSSDEVLPSRVQIDVQPGDRLTLITPGGGGWGAPFGSE